MNNRSWRISRDRVFNFDELKKKFGLLPGVGICLVIVFAAHYLADSIGGPIILYALSIGIGLRQIADHPAYAGGLEFCANTVLRVGIALLGVRMTFGQITDFGFQPLVLLGLVPTTVLFSVLFARLLGMDKAQGIISGCAVGICGAAAALAVAATLPKNRVADDTVILILISIATISTVAMLSYPALALVMGWPLGDVGLFLGASIHDVAHVAGAGYMVSREAGDAAVFMKMLRVAMLVPVVVVLSNIYRRRNGCSDSTESVDSVDSVDSASIIPGFLIAFVLLAILVNINIIPAKTQQLTADFSGILLLMAMVAVGVKARFDALWQVGKRTVLLIFINTVFLAVLSGVVLQLWV